MSRNRRKHDKCLQKAKKSPERTTPASIAGPGPGDDTAILDFCRRLNFSPDPTQARVLTENPRRLILNCTRQWGKSTVTAAKAVHHALTCPKSMILVLSKAAHQSGEFLQKAESFLHQLQVPFKGDGHNKISIVLPNRSRIVGLPSVDDTIRGFSGVNLLLIDEAARVPDKIYHAVRPMLAASNGQLWLISTPNGCDGFFYKTWIDSDPLWTRISVPANQCPRITAEYLEEERRTLGEQAFRREYLCEFLDSDDTVFASDLIAATLADIVPICSDNPLAPRNAHLVTAWDYNLRAAGIPNPLPPPHYFIGIDLGKRRDYTAISILERATVLAGDRDPRTYEFPKRTLLSVRYLERLPLHTPYPDIVDYLCRLVRHPDLSAGRTLIVDATGLGDVFLDYLRKARPGAPVVPVLITSGDKASTDGSRHYVPRTVLLQTLEAAIHFRELQIAKHLPHAETIVHELKSLRRDGDTPDHDDLILATALALWRCRSIKR